MDEQSAAQAVPAEEWKPWKTWGDVPDDVKAHLLEGPFREGVALENSMPLYVALASIGKEGVDQ